MKKSKILIMAVCVGLIVALSLALTGCSDSLSFKKFVGFKQDAVQKIEIVSQYNVVKEMPIDKVFATLEKVTFTKAVDEKYESDWDVNRLMTINFYLKDKKGYYSLVLNNGARAMDGYDAKGKTGFYSIDNIDDTLKELNLLFYSK